MKKRRNPPRIGLDIVSGTILPEVIIPQLEKLSNFLKEEVKLIFFATKDLKKYFSSKENLAFQEAENIIAMEEDPLSSIRKKPYSSLVLAIKMLKEKKLDAFITTGNTGALVAAAFIYLSLFKNITRPALLTLLPTKKRPVAVLDLGANILCKENLLTQFALLGVAFQKARRIKLPNVAILNIGSEDEKGTEERKKAYQKIKKLSLLYNKFNFIGNIEGKDVFEKEIDVLVTDGFSGNIFLKTAEGVASFILDLLQEKIISHDPSLQKFFFNLQKQLHYSQKPGALLCGIEEIVIKCHGYSPPQAIINAIKGAALFHREDLIPKMQENLADSF